MPELKIIPCTRIVAAPDAIDSANWPTDTLALRIAPDEVFLFPLLGNPTMDDPHAIIIRETGFSGVWMPTDAALHFLEHTCTWELPTVRPAFCQGAVAGIPAKIWLEEERTLLIVPTPFALEFEEHLR